MKLRRALRRVSDLLFQSGSALVGLSAIVALWVTLLVTLHYIRETALATARSETMNLARMFEEQITRSIKSVDQSLMFVRESWAHDPAGFDVTSWARSAAAVTDSAIQLTIVSPDGWTRANSVSPTAPAVDLRDREHIRFQMQSDGDELFISKPVIGRLSHRYSIQFTRKLFDASGKFDGIAVVSIDPSYLTRLYASLDLGKVGAVTLFGTDGVVRAVTRNAEPEQAIADIGKVVQMHAVEHAATAHKGFVGPVDFDGTRRITSYRHVRAYPLIVSVGLGESEVLEDYNLLRRNDGLGAIVLTVLLAAATLGMLVHQRRHALARARLRDSERRYSEKSMILETALEHMGQGILMVDGERKLRVCNRRAAAMLDLPPQVVAIGAPFDNIIRHQWSIGEFDVDADLPADVLEFIRSGGISDVPQTYERKRPNGTTIEVRSMPLEDGGVVRTYTDVSVRKAFEEDLRAAHDQAHSAARAKSEFLATMSHEIRSPLSGLVGALDLLWATELGLDQAHMVKLAHGSAHNLLAILNDILDFSKIEAGALTLSVEPVDIRALVSELTQSHALVAQAKGVALRAEVGATVPGLVRTDRLRLGQIVNNLLSNAVKFTARGSVALSVTVERTDGADQLRVAVCDTGPGIDEDTLDRLFQPFMQADGSSSRLAGGTGLGLCISRRLAGLLDGTLTVTSALGAGSCFTLSMRCVAERHSVASPQAASTLALENALAGLHILVVDDNPTNQWLTRRQLLSLGATVEVASNGQAALDVLARAEFGAVITDCHMPGMDGVALTTTIRSGASASRDRPIIGLTADVTREQARRCAASGMNEILYKPVSRVRLAQVLGQFVRHHAIAEPPDSRPVFDDTTFRELFEPGDAEGVGWLRSFTESAATQVQSLGRLVSANPLDRETVAAVAHLLLGASLSVGALRLAHTVRALERAAPDAPPGILETLVATVNAERRAVTSAIAAHLGDLVPV